MLTVKLCKGDNQEYMKIVQTARVDIYKRKVQGGLEVEVVTDDESFFVRPASSKNGDFDNAYVENEHGATTQTIVPW